MAQFIKNRFVKITLWLIAGIVFLFIATAAALQIPYIQTRVVHKLSELLSEKTGFPTTITYVTIDWLDQVTLSGIQVNDLEENRMAYIHQASINYQVSSLSQESIIHFDELTLDSANLFLTKNSTGDSISDLNLNILIRRIKALTKQKGKPPKKIEIGHISLIRSSFDYHNPDKDSLFDRFDYQHFSLMDIEASINDFRQRRDTVSFNLIRLSTIDQATQFKVIDFQTKFSVSQKQMIFNELDVQFGKSQITDRITFNYVNLKSMSDFNNKVNIDAQLKNTVLSTDDLVFFAPSILRQHQQMTVSGEFKGKVNGFNFNKFNITLNGNNNIKGKVSMYGLPDLAETFIDLDISSGNVDAQYMQAMFKPQTYGFLSLFGRTQLNGKFIGYINDFVAAGTFNTQMGIVTSDINLKVAEEIKNSEYKGHLEMTNFDLGKFSDRSFFQEITLNGEIEGKGLNFYTADFQLKGAIEKIGILNYSYTNIETDAHFANGFFEGTTSIDDPNLNFLLEGAIDLREGKDSYNAKINLNKANLKPLNLSNYNILLITDVNINAKGLKIDSIAGKADFRNTFIEYDGKPLIVDSLFISTSHEKGNRALTITSDLFDSTIEGTYNYTTAIKSMLTLLKEYKLNIDNDQNALSEYYGNKISNLKEQFVINYNIHLKEFTPVIQLFEENIELSNSIKLNGMYSNGYTSILSVNSSIDTLSYKGNDFYNLDIDISSSKIADSTNVLAMGLISSKAQKLLNNIITENLLIESIWDNNQIDFEFNVEQKEYNNSSKVKGRLDFLRDTTVIHFDEASKINLFENHWEFNLNNSISIIKDDVHFSDLKLFNKQQSISVNGDISHDPSKRATFIFENMNIGIINPLLNKKITGKLNGFMKVQNFYKNPSIENDISINDFYLDDFLIGDMYGKINWKDKDQSFKIKASLERQEERVININGYYNPKNYASPLDLRANFDRATINILEPFFNKFFTEIDGYATGIFKITGTANAPIINGNGSVEQGEIKVNYLNTPYDFSGDFGFTGNEIKFVDIELTDALGSKADLKGEISHQNFKNMSMDLHSDLSTFQVLNTSSSDNELFYGEGYATGQISFTGPIRNMTITASATSTKGTKIYIPIGDTDNIEQEDYINFSNFTADSVQNVQIDVSESVDLRGLTMNFDLDITPDAYCELIFDIKSGDIIRGRGNGQINLQIDTHGEFNMFGDYILDQGGYNFTLYNIINKEFNLLPESKISWFGDPYQGILDMNATYSQITSLSPLVDTTFQSIPAIRRGYPVDVELMLDGPLLTPTIGFDIDIKDYPATITGLNGEPVYLEDVVTELERRISTDEHELNRQVFSLIVLRKFSPPQSFNTAGSIGNSVSEFISNQLSYWVSQVDENLEVDVDLGKLDDEAFNTFQLRLSYTFLDGRLRVTREGGFSNQDQDQDVSAIVGDWTVEYMLTPDGKLRAKMYNRTNYNALNSSSLNSTATITTGFSLLHTQNFNTIKELLTNERKKQRGKQNESSINSENAIKNEE